MMWMMAGLIRLIKIIRLIEFIRFIKIISLIAVRATCFEQYNVFICPNDDKSAGNYLVLIILSNIR